VCNASAYHAYNRSCFGNKLAAHLFGFLGPRIVRMAANQQLPDGWSWSKTTKQIWEWRCPVGGECGKNNRLLYKKNSPEEAITAGTWHLFDGNQHSDPTYTWDDAAAKAIEGVTESTREWDTVLNEAGEEVPPPTKDWREKGGKGNDGKHKGGGKRGGDNRDRDRDRDRDRERPRSRSRRRSRSRVPPVHELALVRAAASSSTDVRISKVELDHIIDCTSRTAATAEHTAQFCQQANQVFTNAAAALRSCQHTFERFKRA